jgi:hypothetical protein
MKLWIMVALAIALASTPAVCAAEHGAGAAERTIAGTVQDALIARLLFTIGDALMGARAYADRCADQ